LARQARGDADDAARELRLALAELERPGRSLAVAERRSAFLADKWDVYAQLALVERARDRTGAAFEASERLRAREMLELLARGRVGASTAADAEVIGREEDLRRRIGELTREVERVVATRETRGENHLATSSVDALSRAQDEYKELLLEMKERAPRHAALVSGDLVGWRDVARRLARGEALIEYLVSDSGVVAFVVTADTLHAVDLGVRRRELAQLAGFARGVLAPRDAPRSDSLWRAPLRRLYQHLVAPLEEMGVLAGKTRLVLVPHAELHYLPFAALLDGDGRDRFLIERYEVSVTPSASVWLALGDRSRPAGGAGILTLAPSTRTLPASRREAEAIERLAGSRAHVLTGAEATEEVFRREAPSRRVLHLATYGVLNKRNPLFSFVELAPSGAFDGRLEVHEVFGMRLTAELVVLSACQTGVGSGSLADVPPGDDWVGLTRAFLHAGAGRVVASLWPVDDWATATLMERFYEALAAGADPVRALRSAQRSLASQASTAHPFYWAGFVVVGGAGARPVAVTGEGR
jgi:CHAT domain-containing protein